MNVETIKKIDNEKKIDIIFSYLFSDDKIDEEQFFWNNLKDDEISRLEIINDSDDTFDFSNLKSEILWK